MPTINLLKRADKPENEPFLPEAFIQEKIIPNTIWTRSLDFIINTMRSFSINSDYSIVEVDEKNQFGNIGEYKVEIPGVPPFKNRIPILIKKLNHHSHVYEIRIDSAECNHRLLFFCSGFNFEPQTNSLLYILTFGFTKIITDALSDRTDELAVSSDIIKADIEVNESCVVVYQKWLGDDWNVS